MDGHPWAIVGDSTTGAQSNHTALALAPQKEIPIVSCVDVRAAQFGPWNAIHERGDDLGAAPIWRGRLPANVKNGIVMVVRPGV